MSIYTLVVYDVSLAAISIYAATAAPEPVMRLLAAFATWCFGASLGMRLQEHFRKIRDTKL